MFRNSETNPAEAGNRSWVARMVAQQITHYATAT